VASPWGCLQVTSWSSIRIALLLMVLAALPVALLSTWEVDQAGLLG